MDEALARRMLPSQDSTEADVDHSMMLTARALDLRPPAWTVFLGASVFVSVLAAAKAVGGDAITLSSAYLLPTTVVGWYLGRNAALATSLASAGVHGAVHTFALQSESLVAVNSMLLLASSSAVGVGVAWVRTAYDQHREAAKTLEQALSVVRTLRNRVTLCTTCHRMHDATGTWEPLETFVERRTLASIVHRTCPQCTATERAPS